MQLSATINFFNGEEFLHQAVENIRPHVAHLSIVYQTVSNNGHPISARARQVLAGLEESGLVDDIAHFRPDFALAPRENEFLKRKKGVELAAGFGASHILLMDADEFYLGAELERAKILIEQQDISYSCVKSYFHLQQPTYRSRTADRTNVCFIAKISPSLSFHLDAEFPIDNVDTTRRLVNNSGNFYFFAEQDIFMHHMCFVRADFTSKFANSSGAANRDFMQQAEAAIKNWTYPEEFLFPKKPPFQIDIVEDQFGLRDHFESLVGENENSLERHPPAESRKKLLICQRRLDNFTGSEIVTSEIAELFLAMGWDVYLFTSLAEGELRQRLIGLGAVIVEVQDEAELAEHYDQLDLCWVHQQFLPQSLVDYLIDGGRKPFMVFNHMSPYESFEFPVAVEAENLLADLVLFNSNETREKLGEFYSIDKSKLRIFPNPAPAAFENKTFAGAGGGRNLSRVAVVSNHPPNVLTTVAASLAEQGVLVNFIGLNQDLSVQVSPELLDNFDAIVTIGKTVQFCLAMGKPVYVYDRFGGPGYLSEENISQAAELNFSGRGYRHKPAATITKELIEGYRRAQKFVAALPPSILDPFLLSQQIETILADFQAAPPTSVAPDRVHYLALLKAWSRALIVKRQHADETRKLPKNMRPQALEITPPAENLPFDLTTKQPDFISSLNELAASGTEIIIYGAGDFCQEMLACSELGAGNIVAIVDRSFLDGKKVAAWTIAPPSIIADYPAAKVVVASAGSIALISQTLQRLNCFADRIYAIS